MHTDTGYIKILTLLVILFTTGCNLTSPGSQTTTPMVVDLSAVARALGRDEAMQRQLDDAYQTLNLQLGEIGLELEMALKESKENLDANSENSKAEYDKLIKQAQLQLQKTQQLAIQKGTLYRNRLLNQFRQEVLDAAKGIAASRGSMAVVAANNSILWYSSSIDITDETIGVLRERQVNASPGQRQDSTSRIERTVSVTDPASDDQSERK